MHAAPSVEKPESFLTKRRLTQVGIAAVAGCAAACSLPLLLLAAGGGAAATAVASLFGAGAELVVGGGVFTVALAVMVLRARKAAAAPTIPVVCDPGVFSAEERVTHAERARDLLISRPVRRQALDDGLEFHYSGDEKLFLSLAEWAASEHRCCRWARFSIEMEPFEASKPGTLRLRMTGAQGAKDLLLGALRQLESDGPVLDDFLNGKKLGPAGRATSCGC